MSIHKKNISELHLGEFKAYCSRLYTGPRMLVQLYTLISDRYGGIITFVQSLKLLRLKLDNIFQIQYKKK